MCVFICSAVAAAQMDLFVSDMMMSALSLDSLRSSHPISVPVDDPGQINEIFDSISYDKVQLRHKLFVAVKNVAHVISYCCQWSL